MVLVILILTQCFKEWTNIKLKRKPLYKDFQPNYIRFKVPYNRINQTGSTVKTKVKNLKRKIHVGMRVRNVCVKNR